MASKRTKRDPVNEASETIMKLVDDLTDPARMTRGRC